MSEIAGKEYLPLLLKNMATGKDFEFDCANDLKYGYENNKQEANSAAKKRGAVYTPPFLARRMNLYLEFEYAEKLYNGTVIEPCCGEAPFIVQRYNIINGKSIDIEDREGILDIKIKYGFLNVMFGWAWGEAPYYSWYSNVKRMFQTVYGFEIFLPSLIIARLNLLLSFIEYARYYYGNRQYFKSHELPPQEHINEIAEIICWNFWQMDFQNPKDEIIKKWDTDKVYLFRDLLAENEDQDPQLNLF